MVNMVGFIESSKMRIYKQLLQKHKLTSWLVMMHYALHSLW